MNNSNDDNDDEAPHEKEHNKVADFCIGAILFGSFIFIIALYAVGFLEAKIILVALVAQ